LDCRANFYDRRAISGTAFFKHSFSEGGESRRCRTPGSAPGRRSAPILL
jgi:hypothetical protein